MMRTNILTLALAIGKAMSGVKVNQRISCLKNHGNPMYRVTLFDKLCVNW